MLDFNRIEHKVNKEIGEIRETSEETLVAGDEILIGRIALETLGFVVDA
jgi:hypothetical protein